MLKKRATTKRISNMEILGFLEIISRFESQIRVNFEFELLESHYIPYSFGSGLVVYRIKGKTIKIIYDGRDYLVDVKLSKQHEKYPNCTWIDFFSGDSSDFLENGINKLKDKLS
jgi:hypothetical protein